MSQPRFEPTTFRIQVWNITSMPGSNDVNHINREDVTALMDCRRSTIGCCVNPKFESPHLVQLRTQADVSDGSSCPNYNFLLYKGRRLRTRGRQGTLSSGGTRICVMPKIMAFWNGTPCCLVDWYQRFRRICCLHFNPEDPLSR